LPANLAELKSQQYGDIPIDQQLKKNYEYKGTGMMTFELCAEFNKENMTNQNQYGAVTPTSYPVKGSIIQNDNWNHKAGHQCFSRIIDPSIYPTQVKG
jgi:hypothetical protein